MTAGTPTHERSEDGTESVTAAGTPDSEPDVPPGPDGYPIVGNTLEIMREPFGFLDELATYGDVVRYQIAGNTVTALFHPEDIQHVLVEEPDRFERYLFSDRGFDFAPEGVLFTDGEQWATQRQIMHPAFTMERIQSYAQTIQSYADATVQRWDDDDEIALNREFSRLTLEIFSKSLFDLEFDSDQGHDAITRATRVINEQSGSRSFASFVPDWVPTPANRRYKRALSEYRDRVDELIEQRRRCGDDAGEDLLSILLCAEGPDGNTLSEAEIRDNLITFSFAGHETTSLALTYTVLELAQHDDIRSELDAELESVLGGSTPGFEHVPALEYTDQIVTEAMRLYPPAYMIFRKATEDAVIRGYEIPEETVLALPQYRIHRDERFYDDPETFRPERWSDEFEADLPEYAYFPFGGGPRHCIGMRFAMLELKLVVATLAQRFEFELLSDSDPELAAGVTLQPDEDVRVRVTRRI